MVLPWRRASADRQAQCDQRICDAFRFHPSPPWGSATCPGAPPAYCLLPLNRQAPIETAIIRGLLRNLRRATGATSIARSRACARPPPSARPPATIEFRNIRNPRTAVVTEGKESLKDVPG